MSANAWHTDDIAKDLKAGRKHDKDSRSCWCSPGHWYPECSLVVGYCYSIVSLVPSNDEADIEIIKAMTSLPPSVAEEWIKCVRNSRIAVPEPEGVKQQMLIERMKQIIEAQRTPTEREWSQIKVLAGTIVSFWATGYATERSENFGKDLRMAKCILAVRDTMLGENAEHPFDGAMWKWNWLKQGYHAETRALWEDQYHREIPKNPASHTSD